MNLYNLTEEERKLNDLVTEVETEEDQDVVIQLMDEISHQIKSKGTGIIKARNVSRSTIKALDDEIKRLQAYKKSLQNKQANLDKYVLMCMERMEVSKIETNLGIISARKSPASLNIVDENLVPNKFRVITQTESINKNEIKAALKNGEVIPGVTLITGNKTLSIK